MKTGRTIFKTIIITITALIIITIFVLIFTYLCAKGCSDAIKEDLKKRQKSPDKSLLQKPSKDFEAIQSALKDKIIKTSTGEHKINNVLRGFSFKRERIGKYDISVYYQKEPFNEQSIHIPSEDASAEKIINSIKENEERLNAGLGEEYKILHLHYHKSTTPGRYGKQDITINYQKKHYAPKNVTIPAEEESPERIKKAILENEK